ncbi:MAG: DUF996 domain-containing protein [Candidatus Bathyarchaeia archaeon]
MSNIESSKLLAAIGALLLFLTLYSSSRQHYRHNYVAYRHKRYSEHYRDDSIFRYTLNGLILVYWYSSLLRLLQWRPSLAGSPSLQLGDGLLTTSGGIILTIVLILVFTFYILMAKNFRCIFGTLAQRPRENMFHTARYLVVQGAILTIIAGGGLILVRTAWLILAIALFSMKLSPTQPPIVNQHTLFLYH